jgi:mRNA-degrading endonuclease RelE of RelBE toxin-antitoxin system
MSRFSLRGGGITVATMYRELGHYSDGITPKKIRIFKLLGSFGKENKDWIPDFLKNVQTAVHDAYYKLTFKHSDIYRARYELYVTLALIQKDTDPTVIIGIPPAELSEKHRNILLTILEKDKSVYEEEFAPNVGTFETLKKEAEDDLHMFVKSVKDTCEELGGNSMTADQRKKMDILLQQITDVIPSTGSPKSSSAHGGARKTRKGKHSKTSRKSKSVKRLHRRM